MIIKRHMDMEMTELRGMLHEMARRVLGMLEHGLKNVGNGSSDVYDVIFDEEVEVNRLQMRIDDLAWKVMALYQPTAGDLRALIGAIKAAADLERVGDEVCTMCRRSMSLGKNPWHVDPPTLVELGVMVQSLFKDGLTALFEPTEELAESIFNADDAIMMRSRRCSSRSARARTELSMDACSTSFDGPGLERIADRHEPRRDRHLHAEQPDVRHHGLAF